MIYIGYLIILDGQSIKKSVSEISIFELQRPEKCISRLCALHFSGLCSSKMEISETDFLML